MAIQSRRFQAADDTACPVSDGTLSRLYRSSNDMAGVRAIALELPDDVRAKLAVFCYSRAHLREIGREVAAQCNENILIAHAGAGLGSSLVSSAGADARESGSGRSSRKITLATAQDMRARAPFESADDLTDESDES